MQGLTKRQTDYYFEIKSFIERHGYSPTYRDLAKALGVTAPSVKKAIDQLMARGVIDKVYGRAGSITLIGGEGS